MGNRLRAVVVGINEYKDERYRERARLKCARADAEEIARILYSDSAPFQVEKLDLLTDGRASMSAVRESLYEVFSNGQADIGSIALFYFAGHGLYNPKDDRISLCCHSVNFADPNHGGIRLNDIYDLLLRSRAECNIAIIDACYSGGIIDATHIGSMSAAEHARRAIEALRGPDGKTIAIFAACRTDETSRESKKKGHGIYTDAILSGWRDAEACGNDGLVSLFGLADYVTRRFAEDKQVPQVAIRSGKTVVLWKAAPRAADTPPPLPPPVQVAPVDKTDITFSAENIVIPKATKTNPIISLRLAIIGTVIALGLCGLITLLKPVLFFVAVFVAGVLFAVLILWPSRGWALPITLLQLTLLAGFGYAHFSWGIGLALLRWLTGFEAIFWILLLIEFVFFAAMGLRQMIQSS